MPAASKAIPRFFLSCLGTRIPAIRLGSDGMICLLVFTVVVTRGGPSHRGGVRALAVEAGGPANVAERLGHLVLVGVEPRQVSDRDHADHVT